MTETRLFEEQDCIRCGVQFGVPIGYTARRREDKQTFYCPNGHSMAYSESEADRLRTERDRLAQRIAQRDDEIKDKQAEIERQRALNEAAWRRVSAAKGQITKLKNRAAKGVCPCCNRHFTNLERHMHSQHPGFVAEPDASEHVN